jgi:hypothetical protein
LGVIIYVFECDLISWAWLINLIECPEAC